MRSRVGALRGFAAALCVVGLSACPPVNDGSGSSIHDAGPSVRDGGSSREENGATDAGTAGESGGSSGKGEQGGTAGNASDTHAGSGGTMQASGSGGRGQTSDEDAGSSMGQRCGTRGAASCGPGEFCNFDSDKDCGDTDKGGECEAKPDACDADFVPVCGCDSHTYSNACSAHGAGVSIKHSGTCTQHECESIGGRVLSDTHAACKPNEDMFSIGEHPHQQSCCVPRKSEGMTCGGIAGLQCGVDEFCNYELGQGCDGTIADAAGKCEVKPTICTTDYKPVCGCDHKTYSNMCDAHTAGSSILHDGACTVSDCEMIGGRVAVGTGPPAMCRSDEIAHTSLVNDNGTRAIEGMLCCLKK